MVKNGGPDLKRAQRTGLSARRARRTKWKGPKGLQLEVGARRAPRLLVLDIFEELVCYCNWVDLNGRKYKIYLKNIKLVKKIFSKVFFINSLNIFEEQVCYCNWVDLNGPKDKIASRCGKLCLFGPDRYNLEFQKDSKHKNSVNNKYFFAKNKDYLANFCHSQWNQKKVRQNLKPDHKFYMKCSHEVDHQKTMSLCRKGWNLPSSNFRHSHKNQKKLR